jgi:hypothetical protein
MFLRLAFVYSLQTIKIHNCDEFQFHDNALGRESHRKSLKVHILVRVTRFNLDTRNLQNFRCRLVN